VTYSGPVTLYARPNCPLCDEARIVLTTSEIEFREVDISNDRDLKKEYGTLVPVVELNGRPIFHGGMNPTDLPGLITGDGNGRGVKTG
jgi:glutaredoxin